MEPLRIVAIGGGTGLSALLQGLKRYAQEPRQAEITAVVTVTDDGGSSGRLRREFEVLPPGDIRNCMVALSEDEGLLARLFQYRFSTGKGLKGHSFGNLFLTALTNLTGDFAQAVKLSSEVLASLGRIYPSTAANVTLEAELENGGIVTGETKISKSRSRIRRIRLAPRVCKPLPETLDAIAQADLITFGPGSLFTSLIPNLLVHGIPEAIAASKAVKVYVCNLMTQTNESLGRTAADHIRALDRHAGRRIFDYTLLNEKPVSEELKAKYALEGATQVVVDREAIEALGVEPVLGDYLDEGEVARHATDRIAHDLMKLAMKRVLAGSA